MRDRKVNKAWRQAQKRAPMYRWKGFQRENAMFLFIDCGFSARKVADLLGIPDKVVKNFVYRYTETYVQRPTRWYE